MKLSHYLANRYITKAHALTAHKKDIKPGYWCDLTERMLYCLFNELVDFIECEKAHMAVICDDSGKWKSFSWHFRHFYKWRWPEAGLDYLDWEISLTNKVMIEEWGESILKADPDDLIPQAKRAKEQRDLYLWWKNVRPRRIDPYEDDNRNIDDIMAIEGTYWREDQKMLHRLINIRGSLWT